VTRTAVSANDLRKAYARRREAAITSASCAKQSGKGNVMSHDTLSDFVQATATRFGIPGVAVGVWADGR